MDQVQIQCPNCKSVLLVKNTDGSNERVVNCPTCHTPLMVSFGNMAANSASQPYNQTPYPPGPMPAGMGPMPQGGPTQQPISEKPKKNNTWVIALLAVLVLALAGVLIWLLVFKDSKKSESTQSNSSEASIYQTEKISSAQASVSASVEPEASASVEPDIPELSAIPEASVAPEPAGRTSTNDGYSLPYMSDTETDVANQMIKKLNVHTFVNVGDGFTGADFKSLRSRDLSKGDSKQLTVEDSNGYRYQFFFMNSNKYDGKLTGVAVSHKCYDARQECASFDAYIKNSDDFNAVGRNIYQSNWGNYISPGYSKGRLYVYYYLPNAPDKSPAPRK